MKKLLSVPSAIPFLIAVFMNAFVDLGHKIVIQNTLFKIYDGPELVILTAVINGLILLPFILLFSPAGFVSDRFPKHHVMRISAWAAVALTVAITLCYAQGWFWLAFAMTFLLAVQSAFYSPAKYAYLKGFFGKSRLAEANGLVQSISIVAILSGTFAFSVLFEIWFPQSIVEGEPVSKSQVLQAVMPIGFILMMNSIIELIMMYRLPNTDTDDSDFNETLSFKHYITGRSCRSNLANVLKLRGIRLAIIGLAMFWSVGQVMLAAFPAFAKESLGEMNTIIIQGILASTGIGIAIGSILAGRFSKNYIETGLIPIGAAGIAIGLFVLPSLTSVYALVINFLWIGIMGGFFIIPLNALIQFYANESVLGKTLAANNFIQNISMLMFLVITVLFSLTGIASQQLLQLIAFVALVGGIYTVYQLPQSLVRLVMSFIMTRHYKTRVQGMQNIPETGGVLLLGNHISLVDWAIIQIACPRPVHFVMDKSIYDRWYLQWFLKLVGCIPIQSGAGSRKSLESVANLLDEGKVVCLFPEGLLSRTGHLAEFRKGYEKATALASHTEQNPVHIIPFYLHGLWGSQFSRSSDRLKAMRSSGLGREVIIAFGQPLSKDTPASLLKQRIFDLSVHSWQVYIQSQGSLADAWIDTVKRQKGRMAIADTMADSLSATKALAVASAFSQRIAQKSPEQNIGLLLPTSLGGVLANMAGLLAGKTLVNLNYTASIEALSAAIQQAEIKTVYTSQRFLKKLSDKGFDISPVLNHVDVVYLEDIKQNINKAELFARWALVKFMPASMLKKILAKRSTADSVAAILFSSGSEGLPKGVQLTHHAILANVKQVADVLNTQHDDRIMASLPLFHAFGLTVTQFMPLIEGLPMVCHADPTDVVNIAKAVSKHRVTVMCGTSTFLRLYCRNNKVHPLMLDSLRIVVAGAEKLNEDVRDAFKMKFNKSIYEGYGATETAPVASVNIPDAMSQKDYKIQKGNKLGTVGMPLPGTSFKVVDPESMDELPIGQEGMILIGGVQLMRGYLNNPEKNQQVLKVFDGLTWYVTGDKGALDEDGYLSIVDRYSRFAKIGGEMISLSAVEQAVRVSCADLLTDSGELMAVNIPDAKKGESVVLLSTEVIQLDSIRESMLAHACNPLMIPSNVICCDELPKLGSGKMDFSSAKKIASEIQ